MTEITPFSERVRMSLRETLLDAAAELLAERGFTALRMAEVAGRAGVSRQTVYNEFGSKSALVDAVALRTVSEFIEGAERCWRDAADTATAVHASIIYTIQHGQENRLVASVISSAQAEDLLPLLTTRGGPVLRPAIEQTTRNLTHSLPSLPHDSAAVIAETMVRLSVSHMLLPTGTAQQAADAVCAVIMPAIRHYSSTSDG
jgi:AcrR family transcriptional regulator